MHSVIWDHLAVSHYALVTGHDIPVKQGDDCWQPALKYVSNILLYQVLLGTLGSLGRQGSHASGVSQSSLIAKLPRLQ